jgi:hypothetical protein
MSARDPSEALPGGSLGSPFRMGGIEPLRSGGSNLPSVSSSYTWAREYVY